MNLFVGFNWIKKPPVLPFLFLILTLGFCYYSCLKIGFSDCEPIHYINI